MPDRNPSRDARPTAARTRAASAVVASLLFAAAAALPAAAQAPSSRPAPPERGDGRRERDSDGDGRGRPERREPSDQEWHQTVDFLREHAPRRLELYEELSARWQQRQRDEPGGEAGREPGDEPATRPDDAHGIRGRVRSRIFGRVESMRELEQSDPTLFTFVMRQFEIEDDVIGGLLDARRARGAGDAAAAEAADDRVSAAIRRYVENAMAERESRIKRLRADLAEEERRLEHDSEHMDEMMKHLRARYERFVPDDPPAAAAAEEPATRPAD